MTKLKPCPFCGSTEALNVAFGDAYKWCQAECDCGHKAPEVRLRTTGQLTEEDIQRAIEAWNTRAKIEITDEMVERAVISVMEGKYGIGIPRDGMRAALEAALNGEAE